METTPEIQQPVELENDAVISDEIHALRPRIWVEKTLVRGRPDREAGSERLGASLWSPQRSTDGRDVYGNMRDVSVGDLVLHLTDNEAITGVSIVAGPLDENYCQSALNSFQGTASKSFQFVSGISASGCGV